MELKAILQKHKLRLTKERTQIFDYLQKEHLVSAASILENCSEIGRASVFRTLKAFCEIGIVRRVSLGESGDLYELETHAHHEHMKCQRCQRIFAFDSAKICEQIFASAKSMGFHIDEHQIAVTGTCSTCISN